MVNYICPRCNYTTMQKTNFRYHLNRKKICKPKFGCISVLKIAEFYNIVISNENKKTHSKNIPKTFQKCKKNIPKTFQKHSKKIKKNNTICRYCKKVFSSYNNKWKHENRVCKEKKRLEKENKELKYKLKQITSNTISNSNINSNNTNNIIINNFFDKDNDLFTRINNKKNLKLLNNKSYDQLLGLLCKQIYFNDKYPEDKNIKCTNLQSKLCDVYVDDSFKKMPKKDAYEHISDKIAFLIQDLGETNKEKIKNKGESNIKTTNIVLDNPEEKYDNINIELYNNTKNLNI